ncbi:MAG TPA: RNA methyltransferase [Chitinophagaceae bacterium]|nr:RNA methyltransferase [Chitinophagaceae bacterium]
MDTRKLEMDELGRMTIEEFKHSEKTPIIIVLDNIRSLHNVGSVFRTSDAFLLQGIYLCGMTGKPPHRDIRKSALGATDSVNWQYFKTTEEALLQLKAENYSIWAVEQVENSTSLANFKPQKNQPLALIFGNEMNGVSDEALKQADGCIEIPQFGMKHSLNISVSVGIVLWELLRKK